VYATHTSLNIKNENNLEKMSTNINYESYMEWLLNRRDRLFKNRLEDRLNEEAFED